MRNDLLHRALALFTLLLLTTSVFAVPTLGHRNDQLRRPAPQLRNSVTGETNAKRLARGLPPLPPAKRASGTDTAKRSTTSQTVSKHGNIKATDTDGNTVGYLALTGTFNNLWYHVVSTADTSATFNTVVYSSGITTGASLQDPRPNMYLAGLNHPGVELLPSNKDSAIVGFSPLTSFGSVPQTTGQPSIAGDEYESAIWTIDASTWAISPTWVNQDNSSPPMTLLWDPTATQFYITANPHGVMSKCPEAYVVTFSFV